MKITQTVDVTSVCNKTGFIFNPKLHEVRQSNLLNFVGLRLYFDSLHIFPHDG